ncbi:Na/Pi cotransporter family protein [Cohaesibacter celericrescens]|uniref:Na/Pi cotransporter n=1 Tax=Cohaesibacter celericrescens TaxID=2067669 RepID=A0A2N5XW82_9HYPH|nr:Na/Pi cotransporter family protein [Cohaesibacter celericrescens]PLW78685.1 Na/Pi cotransporter [Cohaesibacter celericrescens]
MSATYSLIQILGAVALLLWGLYMVRTGIIRGFGSQLRDVISLGVANRGRAMLAGMGVTMIVQSSTATAMIVASFANSGFMEIAPALAVMLGADIATTLVAQLLSLDLSLLAPLLILGGVILHKAYSQTVRRQIGRSAIGLGLMLIALRTIVQTSDPLRDSDVLLMLFSSLSNDPLIALLLAALLTWLAHSSLAVVLLIMSFASTGAMSVPLALIMVLGANLGGVLPPIMATANEGINARRVTFGNAAFKIIGVLVCLPLVAYLPPLLSQLEAAPARQIVNFHTIFNIGIAVVFIFFVPTAEKILKWALREKEAANDAGHPQLLDRTAIETPAVALSCAMREALRMAEYVETMITGLKLSLEDFSAERTAELVEMDHLVDASYEDIKLYLTKVGRQEVDDMESHRIVEILSFTTNMELIGDIAENLLDIAAQKANGQLRFSEEGLEDIQELQRKVQTSLRLAMTVFMNRDKAIARQLIGEKLAVNALERQGVERHFERLRQGRRESIETSTLHIDILRGLRRVHSHLAAVAYPILDEAGELRKTRLKKTKHATQHI